MSITEQSTSTAGWTVDDSTFAARLALVRQRMGWNIKEAAIECGLPPASWGNWERNMLPRRLVEITQIISKRTGCNYLWLLTGSATGESVTRRYRQPTAPRVVSPTQKRPADRGAAHVRASGRDPDPRRPVLVRGKSFG